MVLCAAEYQGQFKGWPHPNEPGLRSAFRHPRRESQELLTLQLKQQKNHLMLEPAIMSHIRVYYCAVLYMHIFVAQLKDI